MFYDAATSHAKKKRLREIVAAQLGIDSNRLPSNIDDLNLADLGADSLDVVELTMELEDEFEAL